MRIVRPTDALSPDSGNITAMWCVVSDSGVAPYPSDGRPYIWDGVPVVSTGTSNQSTDGLLDLSGPAQPARIEIATKYLKNLFIYIEKSVLFCIILL